MLRIVKPIVLPEAIGGLAIALGHVLTVSPLYRWVLFGAGLAFIAIGLWVITAMITGWNVSE